MVWLAVQAAVALQAVQVQQAQQSQVHKAKTVGRNRQLPQVAEAAIPALARTVQEPQVAWAEQAYNSQHLQVQQLLLGLVAVAVVQVQLHKAQVATQQVVQQLQQVATQQPIAVQVAAVRQYQPAQAVTVQPAPCI